MSIYLKAIRADKWTIRQLMDCLKKERVKMKNTNVGIHKFYRIRQSVEVLDRAIKKRAS